MKIAIGKLFEARGALEKIQSKDLPANISFRLAKNIKPITQVLETFEASRVALVKKYGIDENGVTRVAPDKIPQFKEEFDKLAAEEVEIEWQPISITDIADVKLSTFEASHLEPFITE